MFSLKRAVLIITLLFDVFYIYPENPTLAISVAYSLACMWFILVLDEEVRSLSDQSKKQEVRFLKLTLMVLKDAAEIMELKKNELNRTTKPSDKDTSNVSDNRSLAH